MSTTTDAQLARLIDEAAIREATARFADCCIRQDYDGFAALWASDAVWSIGEPFAATAEGMEEIVQMLRNLWQGNDYFVQFAVQGPIHLDGDVASSRVVCHEAARGGEDRFYRNNGVWSDRLRRTEAGWVFTSRSYQYLWLDTSEFAGATFPFSHDGL